MQYINQLIIKLRLCLKNNYQRNQEFNVPLDQLKVNNYFAATFLLTILKLILNIFCIKVPIVLNICLLLVFFIFSIKINLYKKFKLIVMAYLIKMIPYHVYGTVDGLDPDTVRELNKDTETISYCLHKFVIVTLLRLRLFIETYKFYYILLNIFFIHDLLANPIFQGITYFYLIIVMVSRVLFFLIEPNFTEMKRSFANFQPEIETSKKNIKNTYQNGVLLMHWCIRDLKNIRFYEEKNTEYLPNYFCQVLEQKYIEQEIMEIRHNIKQPHFELTESMFFISLPLVCTYINFASLKKTLCLDTNAMNILGVQFQKAEKHALMVNYDTEKFNLKILVGTTTHKIDIKTAFFRDFILHKKYETGFFYDHNKMQSISDRMFIIDYKLTQEQYDILFSNYKNDFTQNKYDAIKNLYKGIQMLQDHHQKSIFDIIPYKTNITKKISRIKNNKDDPKMDQEITLENILELQHYDSTERLLEHERVLLLPKSFKESIEPEDFSNLLAIQEKYQSTQINFTIKKALELYNLNGFSQ